MPYSMELQWPTVITRLQGEMTDAEQNEYFERIEREVLRRKREHVMLIISSGRMAWTPEQRKRHVAFQKAHSEAFTSYCRGTALVIPEIPIFLRFALSTMLAVMGRSATPTQLFSSEDDARAWLNKRLPGERRIAS